MEEWEIDPSKIVIKTAIARETFGTAHRGIYDGVDVQSYSIIASNPLQENTLGRLQSVATLFFLLIGFVKFLWRTLIKQSLITLWLLLSSYRIINGQCEWSIQLAAITF